MGSGGERGSALEIDALLVTAVAEEYAAVLDVETGAAQGSSWEVLAGATGLDIRVRAFEKTDGTGPLWIAVTQALGMGGVEAIGACAQLVPEHRVRCLAMCGVCAGRPGKVELGDVIIADRLWSYDTGSLEAHTDGHGQRVEHQQGDIEMYRIAPPSWKHAAERFQVSPDAAWLSSRPQSREIQADWILERVLAGANPATDSDSAIRCPNFDEALVRLWEQAWLEDGTLKLTAAGRKHIERVLLLNRGNLPRQKPFRVHVGPIASGSRVMKDAELFSRLAGDVRKVLGVEMEGAAIGALARLQQLKYAVVMKGVMDHADPQKNDRIKAFAARASAECLIAFLREHLPARSPSTSAPEHRSRPQGHPGSPDVPARPARLEARSAVSRLRISDLDRGELRALARAVARVAPAVRPEGDDAAVTVEAGSRRLVVRLRASAASDGHVLRALAHAVEMVEALEDRITFLRQAQLGPAGIAYDFGREANRRREELDRETAALAEALTWFIDELTASG
ncbi:hypothetical protein WME94_55865 [Sorangium sp. So ce429]